MPGHDLAGGRTARAGCAPPAAAFAPPGTGERPASLGARRAPSVDAARSARTQLGQSLIATSGHDTVKEVAAGAILDLEHPRIGIEAHFAHDPLLDLGFRQRLALEASAERAIGRVR